MIQRREEDLLLEKKKYSVFLNAIQEEVADIKQEKAAIDQKKSENKSSQKLKPNSQIKKCNGQAELQKEKLQTKLNVWEEKVPREQQGKVKRHVINSGSSAI